MTFDVPNLTLLRHFVVVAEERGISRAARRLRISQPALSKNIRRLEELLGTALFERHSGGSDLTPTGRTFFDHAQIIGLEYQHALQEIQNLLSEQDATISIGSGPVWTSTVIPAAVPRFHARFPRHRLMVQTGQVDQMIEDLRLGRIEIFAGALIRQNEMPGFRRLKIARAELGVMCSETHPLAQLKEPVDSRVVADYPFVSFVATRDVLNGFAALLKARQAEPPRYMIETSSIYACVDMVRSGKYLFYESTMLASSPIGEGLKAIKLDAPTLEFDMGFVFRDGLERLPPQRGIMKTMLDVFKETTPPAQLYDTEL
ncbi:LysR family transcriptional regulator [Mesorhizobium marinum]|uniref:LysR family transcriptional regulator n=1 Tax=Mesorhizobium marinum TaxID=3228790 RepID=UPI0034678F44